MGKSVAVVGEVVATPGSIPFTRAESGIWTAGVIRYRNYDQLKVNHAKVIYEAECNFSFSGQSSSGATVTGQETVALAASTTILQKNVSNVLVNDDTQTCDFSNKLKVQRTNFLKTA